MLPFFVFEDVVSVAVDWVDADGKTVHYRIDRANEVAAQYQRMGYNTKIIYLGTLRTREYAVDVW